MEFESGMARFVLTKLFHCLFNNSYFSNDSFFDVPLSCVLLVLFVYSFDKFYQSCLLCIRDSIM